MTITGEMFISKKTGFYTTLKGREDAKLFLTVGFRKGDEPEDGGKFRVKDGFLSCYTGKDGTVKPKLMVMDYDAIDEPVVKLKLSRNDKMVEINYKDEDLPF